jgi:FKBP-type peptidyl-prolyl cis-trans isomerase FkpA
LYYDIAVRTVKGPKDLEKAENAVKGKVDKIIADYKANKIAKLQTTASGLKYVVHEEGSGMRPDSGDLVFVHYYGALTDGSMFDNSFVRGSEFPFQLGTGGVIPGWDEGIALLKVGSKATLFVPSALGYGASGAGSIPPDSELIFYVELVSARKL